jgi:hypothetical protein
MTQNHQTKAIQEAEEIYINDFGRCFSIEMFGGIQDMYKGNREHYNRVRKEEN